MAERPDQHHRLGARAVPNIYLVSALGTRGVRNAAHYSNPKFDALVKTYLASPSFKDQNKAATQMQEILLHDTPVVFPYFYDFIAAGSKNLRNYAPDVLGPDYLSKTSLG